jgi:thiamine biosynthesis protein ThiS
MILTVNGEPREFTTVTTLFELVAQLGMKPDRVAVELNRELIPRDRWSSTRLSNGDKLEIVHFVGGGSAKSSVSLKPELHYESRKANG